MLGDIDKNLKPYEYRLFLCKPDRTPIAELPEAYNKNLKLNYGSIHELSFMLPFKIEKNKKFIRNKHVDMLRGHYLIRLERKRKDGLFLDKEYFIITKPKNITDNDKEAKHVQSYLLPYEIRDKIVRRYSGTKKLKEVLAETLEYKTDWTVGHVDLDVSEKYRTFDESQTNLLDFLYKVAETFDVVIKWDTENKIVNFYKNESYGNDRGLLIEYGKYLKTLDEEPDFDNVVTRLYCYGKDDLSIRSVNPSGMDYIESFDYYMYPFERDDNRNILKHSNYMSDELCHAILDYNDLLESKKGEFNNLLLQKQAKQELLTQKQNELIVLNNELKIILDNIDIANANNQPTSDLILQKTAKETEITTKQSEINQINTEINNIDIQISNLKNIIAIENNFTPELIIERNQFIKEYVWSDNNYIDVQELYDDGVNKLKIISQPLVSYQIDIINFLKVVECQRDWEKLVLGDIVTIRYPNFNIDIKAKIIGIENSLDDYNIKLTIANSKDIASGFLTLNEMINRSYSSSIQVDMSKYKWNEADSKATEIEQVINQTWDATARNIKAGVNNSVEINERGIRIVDPSDPQNILIAQHGLLAISNDGGLTWKHAITADGIVGEQIYGKLGAFAKVRADQIIVGDAGEKITDDIIDSSGKWNDMEQNAKTYIDTQVTQLNDSLSELDNTITNAFSDNSITNIEAQSLNLARNSIVKEAEDVKNIASALSISTTALNTAIANLNTEVDKYVGKTNYPIEVTATDRTNLTNAFTALEGAIVQLYKAIDEKRINNIDTSLTNYIDGISNDLTELIDEKIDTWFYAVAPTLNNPPANSWTTDIIKDKHLNDLYYNTTNGYTYRFVKVDGVYAWEKIENKDIADAMAKASKAQDTADGKRTIFTTTPTVPYDVGDLWRVTNVDGVDFKICITAKDENGSYSSSDWANVSNAKDYADAKIGIVNDEHVTAYFPFDDSVSATNGLQPTFTRASEAYLPDGTKVSAGQPRFVDGKFGKGVLVEEGTTNVAWLIPDLTNMAIGGSYEVNNRRFTRLDQDTYKVEYLTDVVGVGVVGITNGIVWTSGSHTISADILDYYLVPGSVGYFGIGRGSYGGPHLHANDGVLGRKAYTYNDTEDRGSLQLAIRATGSNDIIKAGSYMVFRYVQVELNKAYATSYINGTRAAETLTIPTAGVLNPQEGTVEFWIKVPILANYNNFFSMSTSNGRFLLYCRANGSAVFDYGPNASGPAAPAGILKVGNWHHIVLRWSVTTGKQALFIDGVKYEKDLPNGAATSFPSTISVVNTYSAYIDDFRISSRARTDEEIKAYYKSMKPFFDTDAYIKTNKKYNNVEISPTVGVKATHSKTGEYTQLNADGLKRFVPSAIFEERPTGVPNFEGFESGEIPEDWNTRLAEVISSDKRSGNYCLQLGRSIETQFFDVYSEVELSVYITKNSEMEFWYKSLGTSYFYLDGVREPLSPSSTWKKHTVNLTKGYHIIKWRGAVREDESDYGLRLDDITFEANPVELVPIDYETKGYEYKYRTYIGEAATMGRHSDTSFLGLISDIWIQLPGDFVGQDFEVFLSFKSIDSTSDYYTTLQHIVLEVVEIDYERAAFKVRARLRGSTVWYEWNSYLNRLDSGHWYSVAGFNFVYIATY